MLSQRLQIADVITTLKLACENNRVFFLPFFYFYFFSLGFMVGMVKLDFPLAFAPWSSSA